LGEGWGEGLAATQNTSSIFSVLCAPKKEKKEQVSFSVAAKPLTLTLSQREREIRF